MDSSPASDLPVFADIEDAARRLKGWARLTPLLENPILNDQLGFRLLVKPECLQRTGSFKFRGAYNKITVARVRRVIALSKKPWWRIWMSQ